jgi:transposase-like protein
MPKQKTTPSRSHTDRSLKEKAAIVKRIQSGEKISFIHQDTGIPSNTLYDWKKSATKILAKVEKGLNPKVKRDRSSKLPDLDRALVTWLKDNNARPNPPRISMNMFMLKADM